MITYVLLILGVFESISGIITGKLVDKFEIQSIITMNYICSFSSIILSFLAIYLENYSFCFLIGAMWGYTDCCNNVSTPSLISKIYGPKVEPFALFRVISPISYMLGMLISLVG